MKRHINICHRLFVLVASAGDEVGTAAQGLTFAVDWLSRARVQLASSLRSNAAEQEEEEDLWATMELSKVQARVQV